MKKVLTLGIVIDNKRVLLGMKKRGFGAGRWNGFGGKVEDGESIEAATVREFQEEIGITPVSMSKLGVLEFTFVAELTHLVVHIFRIDSYAGEPTESDEMRPQWFPLSDIPFASMWSDDEYWFPYLIAGKHFTGHFLFDSPATSEHTAVIQNYVLKEVSTLPE